MEMRWRMSLSVNLRIKHTNSGNGSVFIHQQSEKEWYCQLEATGLVKGRGSLQKVVVGNSAHMSRGKHFCVQFAFSLFEMATCEYAEQKGGTWVRKVQYRRDTSVWQFGKQLLPKGCGSANYLGCIPLANPLYASFFLFSDSTWLMYLILLPTLVASSGTERRDKNPGNKQTNKKIGCFIGTPSCPSQPGEGPPLCSSPWLILPCHVLSFFTSAFICWACTENLSRPCRISLPVRADEMSLWVLSSPCVEQQPAMVKFLIITRRAFSVFLLSVRAPLELLMSWKWTCLEINKEMKSYQTLLAYPYDHTITDSFAITQQLICTLSLFQECSRLKVWPVPHSVLYLWGYRDKQFT